MLRVKPLLWKVKPLSTKIKAVKAQRRKSLIVLIRKRKRSLNLSTLPTRISLFTEAVLNMDWGATELKQKSKRNSGLPKAVRGSSMSSIEPRLRFSICTRFITRLLTREETSLRKSSTKKHLSLCRLCSLGAGRATGGLTRHWQAWARTWRKKSKVYLMLTWLQRKLMSLNGTRVHKQPQAPTSLTRKTTSNRGRSSSWNLSIVRFLSLSSSSPSSRQSLWESFKSKGWQRICIQRFRRNF